MTFAVLLPTQLLDGLAVLTAFLLGRVAIPITSTKLALAVAPTSIVTTMITTAMISIVMVTATLIRRIVLVSVRILLLAFALSFGAMVEIFFEDIVGCRAKSFELLMIEHIIMIVSVFVVVFLGRVSMAIANDWVHPQEFKL